MKRVILIVGLSLLLNKSFSQSDSAYSAIRAKNMEILENSINDAMSDPALLKPYEVTANHMHFISKSMDLILSQKDDTLVSISQTKGFSGVLISENGEVMETSDPEVLEELIKKLRSILPNNISRNPDFVYDDVFLGDTTRSEIWNFTDTNGKSSRFGVHFTNGQITVFYFKI